MNGGIYMEYLQKVLGLKLTYINDDIKHIPNFIGTRYVLRNVLLDRQKAVFIYPKTELEQIETLKKHISKIKSIVNLPVVMILDEITYRQKEYLLREKIPFVVNNSTAARMIRSLSSTRDVECFVCSPIFLPFLN